MEFIHVEGHFLYIKLNFWSFLFYGIPPKNGSLVGKTDSKVLYIIMFSNQT